MVIHELGHAYFIYKYNVSQSLNVTTDRVCVGLYNSEKEKLFPGNNGIDRYAKANVSEYLAQSWCMYFTNGSQMKKVAPKTYDFITQQVQYIMKNFP